MSSPVRFAGRSQPTKSLPASSAFVDGSQTHETSEEAPMARVALITSKSQVPPEGQAAVDGIVKSRGSLQGPFTVFLHAPELAGRVAHLGEGSLERPATLDDA